MLKDVHTNGNMKKMFLGATHALFTRLSYYVGLALTLLSMKVYILYGSILCIMFCLNDMKLTGHNFKKIKSSGGCCDCGDDWALDPYGFKFMNISVNCCFQKFFNFGNKNIMFKKFQLT